MHTNYNVYSNVIEMMKIRGVLADQLPIDKFEPQFIRDERIVITGSRTNNIRGDATMCVVILSPTSKYAASTGDFTKILKLPPIDTTELMIISKYVLSPHIQKKLASHRSESAIKYIDALTYDPFVINLPRHVMSMPHTICTEAEITELCDRLYTSKEKFPKILQHDPQAIWIGARPSMLIKIIVPSESTITSVKYRYCIS